MEHPPPSAVCGVGEIVTLPWLFPSWGGLTSGLPLPGGDLGCWTLPEFLLSLPDILWVCPSPSTHKESAGGQSGCLTGLWSPRPRRWSSRGQVVYRALRCGALCSCVYFISCHSGCVLMSAGHSWNVYAEWLHTVQTCLSTSVYFSATEDYLHQTVVIKQNHSTYLTSQHCLKKEGWSQMLWWDDQLKVLLGPPSAHLPCPCPATVVSSIGGKVARGWRSAAG